MKIAKLVCALVLALAALALPAATFATGSTPPPPNSAIAR